MITQLGEKSGPALRVEAKNALLRVARRSFRLTRFTPRALINAFLDSTGAFN